MEVKKREENWNKLRNTKHTVVKTAISKVKCVCVCIKTNTHTHTHTQSSVFKSAHYGKWKIRNFSVIIRNNFIQ